MTFFKIQQQDPLSFRNANESSYTNPQSLKVTEIRILFVLNFIFA